MPSLGYRLTVRLAHRVPLGRGKVARSVAGRRAAARRWSEWAVHRSTAEPLVWVHAASVGEVRAAEPVFARLRAADPPVTTVLSYSSPAVEHWPHGFGVAHADYIPLDEPRSVARVLDGVRPDLVAFARGDLWPEFVAHASARRIPIAVLGGTVRPGSRRLRRPVAAWLSRMYRAVAWLGAVSSADADRWRRLGVRREAIHVTGDPRHDQILERRTVLSAVGKILEWAHGQPLFLAGSTDAADEAVVLAAYRVVREFQPDARLIVVPHEPSRRHVDRLVTRSARDGVPVCPWDGQADAPGDTPCVVVTEVGMLADLYAAVDGAYVGGGFSRHGVHALAEAAAYGVPAVCGPAFHDTGDAAQLVRAGGVIPLGDRLTAGEDLGRVWIRWAAEPATRTSAGLAARRVLSTGAARTTAAALRDLLARNSR